MSPLTLEIVEGPDAGKTASLAHTLVIGRDRSVGLALSDGQASRSHARIRAEADGAVVEDLGSSNGTYVNGNEMYAPTRVYAGDELLIGVSVILLRSAAQIVAQPSALRTIPPALAMAPRRPTFVDLPEGAAPAKAKDSGVPELDVLVDTKVKAKARLAPLALLVLVALVVVIYLGSTS